MKLETTKKQGMRRLLKLAKFLRELPPKRFSYINWVGLDWKKKKDLSCGTKACALGWATVIPEFRKLGLYLTRDFSVNLKGTRLRPFDSFEQSLEAAAAIFGICDADAHALFVPEVEEEDATAKDVARKIEKFVKEWGEGR